LGWTTLRARVLEGLSDFDKLHVTFSENEEVENVSALYQAGLMGRMLVQGALTQQQLADRLGKTQGLVSQYLAIDALRPEAKEIIKRLIILTLGHLVQLCRLPRWQDQVALAKTCEEKGWSVRDLKKAVDALLGDKPKPHPLPVGIDPLESVWKKLQAQSLTQLGGWGVEYPKPGQWKVAFTAFSGNYQQAMADFFVKLGQGLVQKTPDPIGPGTLPAAKRLPKTPTEEADYLAAAKRSIADAYVWLYGPDSPYAVGAKGLDWKTIGFKTVEEGAQALLEAARQRQPLVVPESLS
jgi:hypothetical protein